MKHILKCLARLYPSAWRKRYGDEYEALLEQGKPRARDVFDVFWGAFKMQMKTWRMVRITIVCSLAGALAAVEISFTRPPLYRSRTLVSVDAGDPQATRNEIVERVLIGRTKDLWTQPFLAAVIREENLYPSERAQMPLNDVVDLMKKNIDIRLLPRKDGKPASAFAIDFTYPDPHVAQLVDEELSSRLVDLNAAIKSSSASSRPPEIFAVEYAADLPQRPIYPQRGKFGAGGVVCWARRRTCCGGRGRLASQADGFSRLNLR